MLYAISIHFPIDGISHDIQYFVLGVVVGYVARAFSK